MATDKEEASSELGEIYIIELMARGPLAKFNDEKLPIEKMLDKLEVFLEQEGWEIDHIGAFPIPLTTDDEDNDGE